MQEQLTQALNILAKLPAKHSVALCAVEIGPFFKAFIEESFSLIWDSIPLQIQAMYNVDIDGRKPFRKRFKLRENR